MKYRMLKVGERIRQTDEVNAPGGWMTMGRNEGVVTNTERYPVNYYRRPIIKIVAHSTSHNNQNDAIALLAKCHAEIEIVSNRLDNLRKLQAEIKVCITHLHTKV